MAKRRAKVKARKSSSRSTSASGFTFKYDSLTFLVFAVFVLIVAMVLVSKVMGLNFY